MMDRGAWDELQFMRCARGFVLTGQRRAGEYGQMFAFDRIEDLAEWLVEQYRDTPCNEAGCEQIEA